MRGRTLLAWNIRKIRVAKGLSQEALSSDAGLDRAYFGGIEREQENPTIDTLDRIAAALEVDVAKLLTVPREGARQPRPLAPGRKKKTTT